mmetsp:Transcript_3341/g.5756  ORF Transcript_3341/g.5756 Transcript_3341/m.5756 type:complete len:212 (+) Transcript_3341:869-1504(+)
MPRTAGGARPEASTSRPRRSAIRTPARSPGSWCSRGRRGCPPPPPHRRAAGTCVPATSCPPRPDQDAHSPCRSACRRPPSSRPKSGDQSSLRPAPGPRGPKDPHPPDRRSTPSRISSGYPFQASLPCRGSPSRGPRNGPSRPPTGSRRGPIRCRRRGSSSPAAASSVPVRQPASAHVSHRPPSTGRRGSSASPSGDATPTPTRRYKPRGLR